MTTAVTPTTNNITPLRYNIIEDVKTTPESVRKSEFNIQLKDVSTTNKKPSHAKFFIKNTMLVTLRACTLLRSLITTKHIRESNPERDNDLIKNTVTVFRHDSLVEAKNSVILDGYLQNEQNKSPTMGIDVNVVKVTEEAESKKPATVPDAPLSQATTMGKMPPPPPPMPSSTPTGVAASLKEIIDRRPPVQNENQKDKLGSIEAFHFELLTKKLAERRAAIEGSDNTNHTSDKSTFVSKATKEIAESKKREAQAMANLLKIQENQARMAENAQKAERYEQEAKAKAAAMAVIAAEFIAHTPKDARSIPVPPPLPPVMNFATPANTLKITKAKTNGSVQTKDMDAVVNQIKDGNFKLNKTKFNEHKILKTDDNRGRLDFSAMMVKRSK